VIHDVARFARHSHARETALSRICAALAGSGPIDGDMTRVLRSVADNCASRAGLWEHRAPDAAYISVGRPVSAGGDHDAASDTADNMSDDPVLVELEATDGPDITASLPAVLRALTDVESAYQAQASAVDDRLDPPTAATLDECLASISADRQALARPMR